MYLYYFEFICLNVIIIIGKGIEMFFIFIKSVRRREI